MAKIVTTEEQIDSEAAEHPSPLDCRNCTGAHIALMAVEDLRPRDEVCWRPAQQTIESLR